MSAAIADRALSTAALACCPKKCTLEALPNRSLVAEATASAASGASGVVAL
jgi:hypothetical protein